MSIRGVAFDLDYTLAVTTKDRDAILADAIAAVDGPEISRKEYLTAHRNHLTTESRAPIFAELLADNGSDVDPESMATAYRDEITDSIEPLPGVEEFVSDLRSRYRVGLLTNGSVLAQRSKIEHLGWGRAVRHQPRHRRNSRPGNPTPPPSRRCLRGSEPTRARPCISVTRRWTISREQPNQGCTRFRCCSTAARTATGEPTLTSIETDSQEICPDCSTRLI